MAPAAEFARRPVETVAPSRIHDDLDVGQDHADSRVRQSDRRSAGHRRAGDFACRRRWSSHPCISETTRFIASIGQGAAASQSASLKVSHRPQRLEHAMNIVGTP
jgi:hypothetical protein